MLKEQTSLIHCFAKQIAKRIALNGPMSIADYMTACLTDPQYGYYTTREPFGERGDFITAPEISQIFGELIGLWCLDIWEKLGSPSTFNLIELGPGRGILMSDLLRATQIKPQFCEALSLHLIEVSPRLRSIQAEKLEIFHIHPTWHDDFSTLPGGPTIIIANEFFDALPIHQFILNEGYWRERLVGLNDDNNLTYGIGPGRIANTKFQAYAKNAKEGDIVEVSPTRSAFMKTIASHLQNYGGAALIIDYGHCQSSIGDTLQALYHKQYDDPLAHPGYADLTTHVDFSALMRAAVDNNVAVHGPLTQGAFLVNLGLLQRAGQLGTGKEEYIQQSISDAVERLASKAHMGELFKVLAITAHQTDQNPIYPLPFNADKSDHSILHMEGANEA